MYKYMANIASPGTMEMIIRNPAKIDMYLYGSSYFGAAIHESMINYVDKLAYMIRCMIGYDGIGPQLEIWNNILHS